MSATLNGSSKQSTHIHYLKKELGNGDIDSDIKKKLKSSKSKALQNQLKKMEQPMKKFESKRFRPESANQNINEQKQFRKNIKKINENQKKLNQKLKNTQYNPKKNPNNYFSKTKRLPNSIQEIEENPDLARLLIKNPDKMTPEEKIYIASFNDREFKLFIEYLKMKDREIKWQGNGLGSGHYYEGFISILRKCGSNDNERFASLRKFLNINYNNKKAKNLADEKKQNAKFQEEEMLSGNYMANIDNGKKTFEQNTDEMMRELDKFKSLLDQNKKDLDMQRFDNQTAVINNVLDRQRQKAQNDLEQLKELQSKEKSDFNLDDLYIKYLTDNELNKDGKVINENSIGKKISKYLKNTGLTVEELAKRFVQIKRDVYSDLYENFIDLNFASKKFVELRILDNDEADYLLKIMLRYYDEKMRDDFFIHFIEGLVRDAEMPKDLKDNKNKGLKRKNLDFKEEKKMGGDNAQYNDYNDNNSDSEESYDEMDLNPKDDKPIDYEEKVKRHIKAKYLKEFESVLQDKAGSMINRICKGHLMRKKTKANMIHVMILVKRITKLFRKNYENKMKQKNAAAKKITYLMKKNYWSKKDIKAMSHFSNRWLKDSKNVSVESKKNIAASLIQSTWKQHKLFLDQRKQNIEMSSEILKTRTCFICKKNKVYYLCTDCENNHYCEECFRIFHSRGNKRNHNYILVNEIIGKNDDNKKVKPELIDQREEIKRYLNKHHINLYQCLSMWDFKKNNTITYMNLQDALKVGGFEIDKKIQEAILNYSLKYVLNGSRVLNYKSYIISLKFCADFV